MRKGFAAITTILILSAVVLAISTTVTLLSIDEVQSSLSLFKGEDNLDLVEGCTEDYLLKIRADAGFAATNITRPEGECQITITSGNPNWDITVEAIGTNYQRKIRVVFVRNSTGINLTSWKEI